MPEPPDMRSVSDTGATAPISALTYAFIFVSDRGRQTDDFELGITSENFVATRLSLEHVVPMDKVSRHRIGASKLLPLGVRGGASQRWRTGVGNELDVNQIDRTRGLVVDIAGTRPTVTPSDNQAIALFAGSVATCASTEAASCFERGPMRICSGKAGEIVGLSL